MKKLGKIAVVIAAVATLVGIVDVARSETITQEQTFNFQSGSRNLTFNLLDTAFGRTILEDEIVRITVTAVINQSGGGVGLVNLSDDVAVEVFSAIWTGSSWISSTAITLDWAGTSGNPNYSNENDHGTFEVAASDTWSEPITSGSTGTLGGDISSDFYSDYDGTGTFIVRVQASQNFNFDADGPMNQNYTTSTFSGNVTVVYEVVPEPASLALVGFGAVGLIVLYRRHKMRGLA